MIILNCHFKEKNDINGYKENIPPTRQNADLKRTADPENGIMGNLGSYEEKRKHLQDQRKKEYNKMMAEVSGGGGLG